MWWTTLPAISARTPSSCYPSPACWPAGYRTSPATWWTSNGSIRTARITSAWSTRSWNPSPTSRAGASYRRRSCRTSHSEQPARRIGDGRERPARLGRQRRDLRRRQRAPVGAGAIGIDDDVRGQRADLVSGVEHPGAADAVGPGAVAGERGLVHVAGEDDVGLETLDPTTQDRVAKALPAVPARGRARGRRVMHQDPPRRPPRRVALE